MEKRCWFRGCGAVGEPRPTFGRAHELPITLRLCERHLSELARDPARAAIVVERPPVGGNA